MFAASLSGSGPVAAQPDEPAPAAPPATAPATPGLLDEAGAAQWAAVVGAPVEVTSLTDGRTRVMAQPDGTFKAELHPNPVRVERDGRWVDIDRTLQQDSAGRLTQAAVEATQSFSGGGDDRVVADYASADGTKLALEWPTALPRPEVEGSIATYRNIAAGRDLVVEAGSNGFELSVILTSRPRTGEGTVSFPVSGDGITVAATEGGGFDVLSRAGEVVLHVAVPLAWDSRVDEGSANPHRGPTEARLSGKDGSYSIDVTVSDEFLQDPATQFPVTIDPPYVPSENMHTYIDSANPNVSYVGNDWDALGLHVGTYNGGGSINRAMYRFPAAAMLGKQIINAQFATTLNYSWSCNARPVYIYHTDPWGSGATWNNQPNAGGPWASADTAAGYTGACPATPVGFDVSTMVAVLVAQGWSDYFVQIRAVDEGDNWSWKKFATNPLLGITYNSPPVAPWNLGTPFASNPCHLTNDSANPRHFNATAPITLNAFQYDPDGTNLATGFDVRNAALTSQLFVAWTPMLASNSYVSVQIPAGTLPTGT